MDEMSYDPARTIEDKKNPTGIPPVGFFNMQAPCFVQIKS